MDFTFVDITNDASPILRTRDISLPPTPPPDSFDTEPIEFRDEFAHLQKFFNNTTEQPVPKPLVAIIGVGYVGAQLVEAFAKHYNVIAYDLSKRRLEEVYQHLKGLPVTYTVDPADISEATHILIAVPTSLAEDKQVDTTFLRQAIATVEEHVQPGSTVVIESSVAVGTTRKLMSPLVASKNLLVGMSPERVDPGRTTPSFTAIPKIVSGLTPTCLSSISTLYSLVFPTILPVSSPEVAEMTKLYENCQRMVCAAYANEMADACSSLGIDAFEVSAAAASKPFGYLPFRPGPGVGGHCIPVNPYYLLSNCDMPLLEHASALSWQRPGNVARGFVRELLEDRAAEMPEAVIDPSQLRIVVVGIGFKRGQSVLSNSPGVGIIRTLREEFNLHVEFADPLVSPALFDEVPKLDTEVNWNAIHLSTFDGIIVALNQVGLELDVLAQLRHVKVQDYSGGMRELHTEGTVVQASPATGLLHRKKVWYV
ncbi:hypothetical protein J1614_002964 [Plenodomus biglobosus]|nr:hypothetical protein J1614_002964 [Plenodomus biglobosus]